MFFRRMFARKDNHADEDDADAADVDARRRADTNNNNNNSSNGSHSDYDMQRRRGDFRKYGVATAPATTSTAKHSSSASTLHRAATSGPAVVQLTPLWEHILRTRTLPDTVCPVQMFAEFLERLRDPEWQVRQHALRVFVDVLVVMGAKADAFMDPLVPQLVENLGHPAPTVRKGALDCLRVYLAETAMPETILLQILDIGLNQKITNEPFGGRLTCGVMLSLPALVQATMHTAKRHFILRTAIDMLVQKMGQVTHQEITLKVLAKIRELVGESEFMEYMSLSAYREFELLCNVYGVGGKQEHKHAGAGAGVGAYNNVNPTWRMLSQQSVQSCWRSSDEEQMLEGAATAKVIMETEIKINDDTLTMRILEAKDDDDGLEAVPESEDTSPRKSLDTYPNSLEDEVVCGRLSSAKNVRDTGGVIRLLSDSDAEGTSPEVGKENAEYFTVITPSTPSRTPKRVTFGGEVVKMRTPDSDATSSNNQSGNNSDNTLTAMSSQAMLSPANNQSAVDAGGGVGAVVGESNGDASGSGSGSGNGNGESEKAYVAIITTPSTSSTSSPVPDSKTTALSLEILNDNTKPLPRPKTAPSPKHAQQQPQQQPAMQQAQATNQETSPATSSVTASPHSPLKRRDSTASASPRSPRSPFRRISISPVDSIISPKAPHKEIEVLHNLQRDPSPVRARRASVLATELPSGGDQQQKSAALVARSTTPTPPPPPKSWEDLGIVDYDTLLDLRSGNWRHRLQGITQLAEALRTPENLAIVQPCLDSLLRTLLSSERYIEVAEEKHRLLMNLISRLPLDNLEDRAVQIMTGLCRQGGAGANRVCKALMHRLPAATIVLKLLSQEFLHAKSSRFREHALQMVMFALMTFPSTCFDTSTCVTYASYAALNRKRRVRQAALDVLAILGQMTSIRAVLEVVQGIVATREDGAALVSAVRARLARKQLPLVTAEGLVQYTLRVPSPHAASDAATAHAHMGPDIEWITAGVGSVSPSSLKRRAQRNQSFRCLPPHNVGGGETDAQADGMGSAHSGSNHSDDNLTHTHTYCSPPEMYGNVKDSPHGNQNGDDIHAYNVQHVLGSGVPYHYGQIAKKSNADYSNYLGRRMVAKSCSDSSMDGRSSDSTHTSSSGGGGGGGAAVAASCVADNGACGGISGRFTRQTVNSRFPAMDRMDLNATYLRVHKPPTYYPGMGAYAHLQQQQINMSSTYPKINYSLNAQQRRRSQQHQPLHYTNINNGNNNNNNNNNGNNNQQNNTQTRTHPQKSNAQENFKRAENLNNELNNTSENLDGTYTICTGIPNAGNAATGTGTGTGTGTTAVAAKANQQHTNTTATNGRRFVNVEKFMQQSNKSSQTNEATNAVPEEHSESKQATPISQKSATYSQKSTASAQSKDSVQQVDTKQSTADGRSNTSQHEDHTGNSSPNPIIMGTVREPSSDNEVCSGSPSKSDHRADVLRLEEIVDAALDTAIQTLENEDELMLKKNGSLASLQSKTESIKTQLDETPPMLSRTQSAKSVQIEEDIEENGSFVVVEELQAHNTSAALRREVDSRESSPLPETRQTTERIGDGYTQRSKPPTPASRPPSQHRSSIADLKTLSRRNSMVKSMESLYERPPSKQDSLDNTTTSTDSTSQTSSQINAHTNSIIPIKPQHTPLKQKSKTSHFLKSNRRISPVKQSIKMAQAELYPPTMQRFEKPREALLKTFDQLDSSNWEIIILGLKSMVRMIRYHPEHLENQMHMVCIQLTRSVRNLRSQVARAACQAATELFTLKSKYLEQECDDLICALLHRTADTNRFLRADATRALESMCDNLTPPKILNILTNKGAQHLNAVVRTTTAKLLYRLVERLGCDKVFTMPRDNRDKFFVTGANLLMEGSLETRSYAKSLFRLLSNHHNYNKLVREIIPPRTYRNVEKSLKSIH